MKVRTFGFITIVLVWVFAGGAFATTDTALQFDGANDYVTVPSSSTLSPQTAGAATFSTWVKIGALPAAPVACLAKGASNAWEYDMGIEPTGTVYFNLWRPTGSTYAVAMGGSIPLGQWVNITGTYTQNEYIKVYLDGALVGQSNSFNPPLGSGSGNFHFGTTLNSDYPNWFNGDLDNVSIWNYTMTDAQVQQLYNTPLLTGSESGLAAYWNFNEGSGQVVNDVTGHGNNGVLGSTTGADASDPTWVAGVPEPATMALLALGGLMLRRYRR